MFRKIVDELKNFFIPVNPDYEILVNSYKNEYWVVNREGDLVYRSVRLVDCERFIDMNTRKVLK